MRTVFRKLPARHGRGFMVAMATCLTAAIAFAQTLPHPTSSGLGNEITVLVHWDGAKGPSGVNGPGGDPFENKGSFFAGTVSRPRTDVEFHDLEVAYDDHEYPLRLRVHPHTSKLQVTVALERPKSCADVFLRKLEKPTLTQTASVKAAFTLGYMIDGRAGENSCEQWPLRAARARFDRYHNAMERSTTLAIPEAVKAALRAAATTASERTKVAQIIADGEAAEKQRFASALQNTVLAALKSGDVTAAYEASAMLLETSRTEEFSSAVASQITTKALEKQTADLGVRADVAERQAEIPPQQ